MGGFISVQDHPVIKVWCNATILKVSLPPCSVPRGFHWHTSAAGSGSALGRGAPLCTAGSAGLEEGNVKYPFLASECNELPQAEK